MILLFSLSLAQEPTPVDPSTVPFPVYPAPVPPPPGVEPPADPAEAQPARSSAPPLAPPSTSSTSAVTSLPSHPPLADGEQIVTIYLRGLPSGAQVLLQRGEDPPITMVDPGIGVLTTELVGPAARFVQLRMTTVDASGAQSDIFDGLVVLGGASREFLAFTYQDRQALRLPLSPSGRTEVALDQRVPWWIAFGWAAIVATWLAIVSVTWVIKGRAR